MTLQVKKVHMEEDDAIRRRLANVRKQLFEQDDDLDQAAPAPKRRATLFAPAESLPNYMKPQPIQKLQTHIARHNPPRADMQVMREEDVTDLAKDDEDAYYDDDEKKKKRADRRVRWANNPIEYDDALDDDLLRGDPATSSEYKDRRDVDQEKIRQRRMEQGDWSVVVDPRVVDMHMERQRALSENPFYAFARLVAGYSRIDDAALLLNAAQLEHTLKDVQDLRRAIDSEQDERFRRAEDVKKHEDGARNRLQAEMDIVHEVSQTYMPDLHTDISSDKQYVWKVAAPGYLVPAIEPDSTTVIYDAFKILRLVCSVMAGDWHDPATVIDPNDNTVGGIFLSGLHVIFSNSNDLRRTLAQNWTKSLDKVGWKNMHPCSTTIAMHVVVFLTSVIQETGELAEKFTDLYKNWLESLVALPDPIRAAISLLTIDPDTVLNIIREVTTGLINTVASKVFKLEPSQSYADDILSRLRLLFILQLGDEGRRLLRSVSNATKNLALGYTSDTPSKGSGGSALIISGIIRDDAKTVQDVGPRLGEFQTVTGFTLNDPSVLPIAEKVSWRSHTETEGNYGRYLQIEPKDVPLLSISTFAQPPLYNSIYFQTDSTHRATPKSIFPARFVENDTFMEPFLKDKGDSVRLNAKGVQELNTVRQKAKWLLNTQTIDKYYDTVQLNFDALERNTDHRISLYDMLMRNLETGWNTIRVSITKTVFSVPKVKHDILNFYDKNLTAKTILEKIGSYLMLGAKLSEIAKLMADVLTKDLVEEWVGYNEELLKMNSSHTTLAYLGQCSAARHCYDSVRTLMAHNAHTWLDARLVFFEVVISYSWVRSVVLLLLEICILPVRTQWEGANAAWKYASDGTFSLDRLKQLFHRTSVELYARASQRAFSAPMTGSVAYGPELQAGVASAWSWVITQVNIRYGRHLSIVPSDDDIGAILNSDESADQPFRNFFANLVSLRITIHGNRMPSTQYTPRHVLKAADKGDRGLIQEFRRFQLVYVGNNIRFRM